MIEFAVVLAAGCLFFGWVLRGWYDRRMRPATPESDRGGQNARLYVLKGSKK